MKIRYKTLSWQLVAVLMIAEIVSNGMLSLPSSLAVVGLVPGVILIVFLGVFGLFTSWILIQFKLRHPEGMDGVPFPFPTRRFVGKARFVNHGEGFCEGSVSQY